MTLRRCDVPDRFVDDFCEDAFAIARAAGSSIPGADPIGRIVAAGHLMRQYQRHQYQLVEALAVARGVEPCVIRLTFGIDPP